MIIIGFKTRSIVTSHAIQSRSIAIVIVFFFWMAYTHNGLPSSISKALCPHSLLCSSKILKIFFPSCQRKGSLGLESFEALQINGETYAEGPVNTSFLTKWDWICMSSPYFSSFGQCLWWPQMVFNYASDTHLISMSAGRACDEAPNDLLRWKVVGTPTSLPPLLQRGVYCVEMMMYKPIAKDHTIYCVNLN